MIEFKAWPKIPRLNREIVITEKIDGTNGAIHIEEHSFGSFVDGVPEGVAHVSGPVNPEHEVPDFEYLVGAQSRKRVITPNDDNHGFAKWVHENAEGLVKTLGTGTHFGEWWGAGINRGYGRAGKVYGDLKTFSLFNTKKWTEKQDFLTWPDGLDVVPVLYEGPFRTEAVSVVMEELRRFGSWAQPGFMKPEGVVVFHVAGNMMFKATIENDEAPKALAA